jgi:ketosteroid isomerase-like protein
MGGLRFKAKNVTAYVTGDTAMTRFQWELLDPSGAVAALGTSVEVQRRDADGIWRLVIDDTNGGARV